MSRLSSFGSIVVGKSTVSTVPVNKVVPVPKSAIKKDEDFNVDILQAVVPKHLRSSVTEEFVDKVNKSIKDPEFRAYYRDNLIGLTSVLNQGRFQLDKYANAVRYVSFKQMGCTNKDAYVKTFPAKYADFITRQVADKDIASYYTAYDKSKLVSLIKEQGMIPSYIQNMDVRQKVINKLASIALDDEESTRNQIEAGKIIVSELKPPEESKLSVDIGVSKDSFIEDFNKAMGTMVESQMELIKKGADLKTVTNAKIILTPEEEEEIINV